MRCTKGQICAIIEKGCGWRGNYVVLAKTMVVSHARVFRIGSVRAGGIQNRAGQNEEETMSLVLTDEQECELAPSFTTAAGNPGRVDGVPVWSSSNPDVLDLQVSDDGLQALVTAKGPLGSSQVSVTVDADLGEGVRQVVGVLDVIVQAAEVVAVGIVAGTPKPKRLA